MDKNPKRVEAGKKAAATRWGEPRVVRLDDLTPAQRRLVLALVEAQQEANDAQARRSTGRPTAERQGGDPEPDRDA